MKFFLILTLFFLSATSQAEVIDAKAATIFKSLDGNKVKVQFGNRDYWIPKKDVLGDISHLQKGQAIMISLKAFETSSKEKSK